MVKHNEETGHPIALSFSDISVWCYACDDYIDGEVSIYYYFHVNYNSNFKLIDFLK